VRKRRKKLRENLNWISANHLRYTKKFFDILIYTCPKPACGV
jgi:hypothetical protein